MSLGHQNVVIIGVVINEVPPKMGQFRHHFCLELKEEVLDQPFPGNGRDIVGQFLPIQEVLQIPVPVTSGLGKSKVRQGSVELTENPT